MINTVAFWAFALSHAAGILFGIVVWFAVGFPSRLIERMTNLQ